MLLAKKVTIVATPTATTVAWLVTPAVDAHLGGQHVRELIACLNLEHHIAVLREGADVLISYLNEHEDAKDTAKYVEEAGRKCVLVPGDLADRAHQKTIIPKAVEEFGKVDVLVNNAAFQMSHDSVEEISDEEWDSYFGSIPKG